MTEKIQKAIDKIDQEAEKMGSATVRLLCSHIIDHCLVNDENADKVLDEGKSLKGCWDHITRNQHANCRARWSRLSWITTTGNVQRERE